MAYYSDDDEEQGPTQTGSGAISKPGSGIVSGATGGGQGQKTSAAPAEAAKQTTPGNSASPFVGIKEYLNANKQQSGKLGGQVGGFVNQRIDNANTALTGAEQNFDQQVDQNTVRLDNNLLNEIKADPTKVAADQAKLAQAKAMQKGYAGPTDFKSNEAFTNANQAVQKAQNTVQNLGNAAGQKQVLTEQQLDTRGGKVNRGAATLDQALLQASPDAREALKPAIEKGAGLNKNLETTIANAMNKVTGATNASKSTNKAVQDFYNQQFSEQQSALNQKAAAANQQTAANNAALQQRLYGGSLTDQDLGMLGLGRGEATALRDDFAQFGDANSYGLKGMDQFSKYFQTTGSDATAQNIASAEDYARAQALSELAGFGGEYLNNPALAGTYNQNRAGFDLAGARNFVNARKPTASNQQQYVPTNPNAIIVNPTTGGPQVTDAEKRQLEETLKRQGEAAGGEVLQGPAFMQPTPSDEKLKKDKKYFDAKKFLEAVGGRK